MSTLALYLLSLILWSFPPGKTARSEVVVSRDTPGAYLDTCYHGEARERRVSDGKDEHGRPLSHIEHVCRPLSSAPGEWVRLESREEGAARLEVVASAEADAAQAVAGDWPEGEKDLARAGAAAFGWSMGFHEGAQTGRLRGPVGEACLADLHPDTLRQFGPPEFKGMPYEQMVARVVGRKYPELRLCFDIGFRVLLNARRAATRQCRSYHEPIEKLTFAMYGTGRYCSTPPPLDWAEGARYRTLEKFRSRTATIFPDWYTPPKSAS